MERGRKKKWKCNAEIYCTKHSLQFAFFMHDYSPEKNKVSTPTLGENSIFRILLCMLEGEREKSKHETETLL